MAASRDEEVRARSGERLSARHAESVRTEQLGRLLGAVSIASGCALGLFACAGEDAIDDEQSPSSVSEPIRGGAIDTDTTAVFAMAVQRGEDSLSLCTATLIERNLFLTARHCLVDTARVVECGQSEFEDPEPPLAVVLVNSTELDEDALENAPVFHGVALYLPATSEVCGADIALVETTEQVPPSVAEPLDPRLTEAAVAGELYEAIGYGGTNDEGRGSGIRRSRQDLRVLCGGQDCGGGIADSEFLGEVGTCQGDSGGPSLDRDGAVLGVLSRGGEECTLPIYGSTAAWARLISMAAQSAAERGGYAPPSWSQGDFPPDPGSSFPPPGEPPIDDDGDMSSGGSACAWVPPAPSRNLGGGAALVGLGVLYLRRRRSAARPEGSASQGPKE
jgi:hypothetical protein